VGRSRARATLEKYACGDRISWEDFGRRFGTVESIARVQMRVCPDLNPDRIVVVRRDDPTLLRETPDDVARRDRAARLRAWLEAKPRLKMAQTSMYAYSFNGSRTAIEFRRIDGVDEARRAIAELESYVAWVEAKPEDA